MNIPVALIAQYGNLIGAIYYDTTKNKFEDIFTKVDRNLPIQDYLNCTIENSNICTIVGRNDKCNEYVVCFGDNFLYSINKETLLKYTISNAKIDKIGRIRCIDKINDLGYLFTDTQIKFNSLGIYEQGSSLGIARKFIAEFKGNIAVVKFSKNGKNLDIINEKTYYEAAKALNVRCCKALISEYYLKKCCISIYEYDIHKDIFQSFKNTNKSIGNILSILSKNEIDEFNKMMILDYILSQQDRHMSNLALVNNKIYPLFDNGECLGIGSIGPFSSNYRKYVESLDKTYVSKLIDKNKLKKLENIAYYDKNKCLKIIVENIKELRAWS